MKNFFLKTGLTLLCLIIGLGSAWGETVTYTQSSTSAISTSGTAPTGSSATFSTTYSNAQQLTKGNSMTLTLKGYDGYKITNITLSMKSNKSDGAGSFTYTMDNGTNWTYIVDQKKFNTSDWYGAWSTSYVNVSKSVNIVCNNNDIQFVIAATVNSLYCQSFTFTYEAATPSQPYTVTLGDDNTTLTETSAGAGVNLPTRNAVGDYTFAGWSTTNVTEETTTAPTTITEAGNYNPTADITLYPIYTKTGEGSSSTATSANLSASTTAQKLEEGKPITYKTSAANTYSNPLRVYKGNTLTISGGSESITKIVLKGGDSSNPVSNLTTTTGNRNLSGIELTWTGNASTISFTASEAQARVYEITVTYGTGGATYYTSNPSGDAKNLTSIEVTGTPAEFWKGDDFNHNGITVTANYDDSSSEDVTNSATFSTPDMSTAGEKTVTVTYQDQTDTYNITVNTIANTQATAYTVAHAKELIDAGKDLSTEVYVAGKISQVDSYSSTYKSITYWISTDGTTSGQFEIYGGKGLENADFSSMDDVQVGAEVIVYGKLKKFNSTYELDSNNYLVSYSYTPPTTDFIKTPPTATVKVLDPISIKDYINGEYSSYDITTSIDGKTQKDHEFVCIYDQIRFCKGGTYVVDVTGTSGSDTQSGQVTFTVTPSDAELSSVTIGGTLTKTIYTVGDAFDFAGLTLTANCSDGTSAYVTDEAEWEASPAIITDGTTKVTVTATYCGMTNTKEYDVTVNADYATLPFKWNGGASADFTALTGVTAGGLGSDYAASNAPYRIKLDTTGDYFQVKTNEAIGICTVGVKMLGGATASSIKVQGSADGEIFTDVETLTISGKQHDELSLSTTSNLDESYRYVRFVFTKGSNVGVGPITIAKPDNTPTYTVTVASDIEHGTVTTSADRAKENDEITVTVNPDTHYHLASLYYTEEGDATQHPITATDNVYSFTMPATNVTVSATFEEDAKYTIAWSVNGTIVQTKELYEGEYITPVDPESTTFTDAVPTGVTKVFTGWVTTPAVDANTPPSYETPAATAKENVTYYAVFANKTGSGSGTGGDYELVESALEDWTGEYIIAGKNEDSNYLAALPYESGNNVKSTNATVTDNKITSDDAARLTVVKVDGNYYTINDGTYYWYAAGANSNNYMKGTSTASNDNAKWTISYTEGKISIVCKSDISRNTIRFNSGNDPQLFSCYEKGKQNDILLFKKSATTGGATYSDFTTLVSCEISISQYGATSFSVPRNYTMPTGITGKTITANKKVDSLGDGYYKLTYSADYEEGSVVPAGESLVLYGEQGKYTIIYEGTPEKTLKEGNLLHSVYEPQDGKFLTTYDKENSVSYYYYKLTTQSGANFGWYYGDPEGAPFLMSRDDRAYLVIAKEIAAGIRGFALEDGEEEDLTTGIDNMETNSTNSIYNLQGLQQSKLQKGINIVNGKKVIR